MNLQLSDLLVQNGHYAVPDELLEESIPRWRRFFEKHPRVAKKLLERIPAFQLLVLADALPEPVFEYEDPQHKRDKNTLAFGPGNIEQAEMITKPESLEYYVNGGISDRGVRRVFKDLRTKLVLGLSLNGLTKNQEIRLLREVLEHPQTSKLQMRTVRYRKMSWSVALNDDDPVLETWLPRFSVEEILSVAPTISFTGSFRIITNRVGLESMATLRFSHEPFSLALMRLEDLQDYIDELPEMGQLLLGNAVVEDKGWMVEKWVGRLKYVEPREKNGHWYTQNKVNLDSFNPVRSTCDVRGLSNKFFSATRLDSFALAVKDLRRVRVIANDLIVKKLRDEHGLDRAYTMCEYEDLKEGNNHDDSRKVLQAAEGVH